MAKGKTLDHVDSNEVHVAGVVHHGEQIILPEDMKIEQAIKVMLQRLEYMEQEVNVQQEYDRFPWDGAWALAQVLKEKYGWARMQATKSMFGSNPPTMINVEIAPGDVRSVPWGQFTLPNLEDGTIDSGFNGRQFVLRAKVKRKFEDYVRQLFADVKQRLDDHSIYMGQPVRLSFEEGEQLPKISFVSTADDDIEKLIYSREVEGAVRTNLFTPIERVEDCLRNGISVKRGILLAGHYGCGKTLAAKAAARLAQEHGVTFIYIDRAADFAKAIEFAKIYSKPASVVFCEDIDRAMSGERTAEVDDILNILDGVDSKAYSIMTVLTTNNLDRITPAMQRPGRLDAIIEVGPPDAEAAERLVRAYGAGLINSEADLTEVGKELEGYVPAVLAEVVKRAKLSQLRLLERGEDLTEITPEALLDAAVTIRSQAQRLKTAKEEAPAPSIDRLFHGIVDDRLENSVLARNVQAIHRRVEA